MNRSKDAARSNHVVEVNDRRAIRDRGGHTANGHALLAHEMQDIDFTSSDEPADVNEGSRIPFSARKYDGLDADRLEFVGSRVLAAENADRGVDTVLLEPWNHLPHPARHAVYLSARETKMIVEDQHPNSSFSIDWRLQDHFVYSILSLRHHACKRIPQGLPGNEAEPSVCENHYKRVDDAGEP